ncbi:MAG TPA: hypothetical protein VEA99_08310, partial [Gemmatimonadaceae bacterium]|nr:hypothetical protein [Gemmatimonadaceae bacterium]
EVRERSVGIVASTHPLFSDAVERAVLASRFLPARRDGRAVPQVMVLPFKFQLDRSNERD